MADFPDYAPEPRCTFGNTDRVIGRFLSPSAADYLTEIEFLILLNSPSLMPFTFMTSSVVV